MREAATVDRPAPAPTLRRKFVLPVLVVGGAVAVVASVAIGSVAISPVHVVEVITAHLSPWSAATTGLDDQIIWQFRLPRALLGFVVGAALAVAGAVLQAVVRNPLADPFVFGVSSGASLAAVAALTLTSGVFASVSTPVAAFAGALATTIAVFVLAQRGGRVNPSRLVLAGVAVSYLLSSLTSYLVLRASGPGSGVGQVLSWLAGSLAAATWDDLGVPTVVLAAATVVLVLFAGVLNAFLIGDETAASLGIDVARIRLLLFAITSLLVGVAVAVSGAIGFVGLVVPHAIRMLVGSDHRWVLPASALAGGLLLVVVDIGARLVLAPSEIPVGLLTAVVGAPFFLWLLRRAGREDR